MAFHGEFATEDLNRENFNKTDDNLYDNLYDSIEVNKHPWDKKRLVDNSLIIQRTLPDSLYRCIPLNAS